MPSFVPRRAISCSAALVLAAASVPSATEAREKATLEVGALLAPEPCEGFTVEDYTGTSCSGAVQARVHADVRPAGALLVVAEGRFGVWADSDSAAIHDVVGGDAAGERQPFSSGEVDAFAGAGIAGGTGPVEMRLAFGVGVHLDGLTPATEERLKAFEVVADPRLTLWLGFGLEWGFDADAGRAVRLGARFRTWVGNEVAFEFNSDVAEFQEEMRILASDDEVLLAPAFALAVLEGQPVGFHFEVGPAVLVEKYSQQDLFEMAEVGANPAYGARITPALRFVLGAQFRLGLGFRTFRRREGEAWPSAARSGADSGGRRGRPTSTTESAARHSRRRPGAAAAGEKCETRV